MKAFWDNLRAPVRAGIYFALVADAALVTGALNGTTTWRDAAIGAASSGITLVVGWFAPSDTKPVVP